MADVILSTDLREPIIMLERMEYRKVVKTKDIRKEVRKSLVPARNTLQGTARNAMADDPRKAYKAVKIMTYRDGNGGNISILNRKSAVKKMALSGQATGGISGIRRKRYISKTTRRTRGYIGADRAFILRFINSGTQARHTQIRNPGMKKSAYRGSVSARNFFKPRAESEITKSGRVLSERIVKLILEVSERK